MYRCKHKFFLCMIYVCVGNICLNAAQASDVNCFFLLDQAISPSVNEQHISGDFVRSTSQESRRFASNYKNMILIPGMKDASVLISNEKSSCLEHGCNAAVYIKSSGYIYISPIFAVDGKTVASLFHGFFEFNPFYFVSDPDFDVSKAIAFTVSTKNTQAMVSYVNQDISIPDADFWTGMGGSDWGAVPSYLVGLSKRTSYQDCNP